MSMNPLMGSSRLPPSNGVHNMQRTSNGRSLNSTHSSPSITLERVMKDHHSSSNQPVKKDTKLI